MYNEDNYITRKSLDRNDYYKYSADLKSNEANQRIQQIKRKYDTPSRRERIQSLKRSKDFDMKENSSGHLRSGGQALHSNPLKESFAVNRFEKNLLKGQIETKEFINLKGTENGPRRSYEPQYKNTKIREDQEAIFSKMREMKESFINNDYMKSSIGGRGSNIQVEKERVTTTFNDFIGKRDQYDPRVENIDKINSKIKQILSCLSQNQKKPSKYFKSQTEPVEERKPFQTHFHKNSQVLDRIPIKDFPNKAEVKLDYRPEPKIDYRPEPKFDEQYKRNYEYSKERTSIEGVKPRERAQYSVNKVLQKQKIEKNDDQWKNRSILNGSIDRRKEPLKVSRSKSYIQSIKKSLYAGDNYQLNSGKKVNDEITKIQKKIEQFQEEKKKLNIEFTPFSVKTKSTTNLNLVGNTRYQRKESPKERQPKQKISTDYNKDSDRAYSFDDKKQDTDSNQIKTKRIDNTEEENDDKGELKVKNFDEEGLKKRTGEGMEQRKKRLLKFQSTDTQKKITKKLVFMLCEQVKLDQELRNLKIWFESVEDKDKFRKLASVLEKSFSYKLTEEQCKQEFTLSENENNPFFTIQGFTGSIETLAQSYSESKSFWIQHICHQFSRTELEEQSFTLSKIDLQKKGIIQLQDFVRFLNIQSGTFYRNRDIYLIFKRVSKNNKGTYESLMNQICQ